MVTIITPPTPPFNERGGATVSGEVWKDSLLRQDGVGIGNVRFEAGSRTHWHTHEGGQLLIVTSGEALVVTNDGPQLVRAGEMAWTPPQVAHWHGATSTGTVVHLGISVGTTTWLEAATDVEYADASSAVAPISSDSRRH